MNRLAVVMLITTSILYGADSHASYCTSTPMYTWVDVQWWDGTTSGHWQFAGWVSVCSATGSGGSTGGGGGGGGTTVPNPLTQDKIDQLELYEDAGCEQPDHTLLLDQAGFSASDMGAYTTWADYKMSDLPYVLVSQELVEGMINIGTCMDNQVPRISAPGTGGGYRTPGLNANTPCGKHVYGLAIDLSIRAFDRYGNNTGPHDCQLWNALATCAHEAGGWVEPWSAIKASGVLHFHVSFGQPPNSPRIYGDACANP